MLLQHLPIKPDNLIHSLHQSSPCIVVVIDDKVVVDKVVSS